ncbi:hypothetical protein PGB90_001156 [Kerria lacca]
MRPRILKLSPREKAINIRNCMSSLASHLEYGSSSQSSNSPSRSFVICKLSRLIY